MQSLKINFFVKTKTSGFFPIFWVKKISLWLTFSVFKIIPKVHLPREVQ